MFEADLDRRAQLGHFARRLSEFGSISEQSLGVLEQQVGEAVHHARGTNLTARPAAGVEIVLAGWACTMSPDTSHSRQIFSFVLPGDVLGSFWRRPEFTFSHVHTLTAFVTAPAHALLARTSTGRLEHPEIVGAARRAEDYAGHLAIDHIVRLGGRDAYAGLAHLLLELHGRLERVGLATSGAFRMPIGQRVLAQATGFSVVHINQTLQRMAADGLFKMTGKTVQLLAPEQMAKLANFTAHQPVRSVCERSAMDGLDHEP